MLIDPDIYTDTTCADVAADANIKTSDLTTWNPWVGSNCDKGLFAGLTGTQERAVCIGVNTTSTSSSTRATSTPTRTTSTSTRASTTSSGPPAATQTGIVANCTKYYVAVKGDGCWAIANANGITLDQFYAWNPAGKSDMLLPSVARRRVLRLGSTVRTIHSDQLTVPCPPSWF
jgi:hypothetical protein